MHNWAANRLHQPAFLALEPLLPPLVLAKLMCWFTIVTELGVETYSLPLRSLYPVPTKLSILLHFGMLLSTGTTFTLFFYAMTAAMPAFVDWPIVLAAPGQRDSSFHNVLVAILLVLFSPLFTPIGEALYRVLARNRHRLAADSHCER